MNKKRFLFFSVCLGLISTLFGCQQLHVHDYSSEYYHNENEHWQVCSKCGEKINVESHLFNQLTDTCLVCKYKDPICITEKNKHMTGLTNYGKTKLEVSVPNGITYIDNGAFKDSKAVTVNLTKDIIGIYKDAFTGSQVSVINTEEELVNWVEFNGVYYKDDILKNYEAMIDGVTYVTLKDAIESVGYDDTTITILKDNVKVSEPVEINHTITLESYHSTCELEANFNIKANGWVKILPGITYKGHTKLLLTESDEKCGPDIQKVYSTGSLIFSKKSEKPENVKVSYVTDFSQEDNLKAVKGSKQIVNEALVIPTDYYVYGTFVMSMDFSKIMGLSPFGKTISALTITNLIENEENYVEIAPYAFITFGRMDINIGIKTIVVRGQLQKGNFHDLTISDHIKKIGSIAFSTRVTHDASEEFRKMIALITSPLYTLKIGDDVEYIGEKCFEDCESLVQVEGGKNLKKIETYAFHDCANLKSVDFSESLNLEFIGNKNFEGCLQLKSVKLPIDGWDFGGHGYLPTDMTPENTAYFIIDLYKGNNWVRTKGGKICYYNPNDKDADGRYNKVHYAPTLQEAIDKSNNDYHIFITKDDANKEFKDIDIKHRLHLDVDPDFSCSFTGNLTIEKDCYLKVGENVNFDGNVILKRGTSGNTFKNQAGLAIIKPSNSSNEVFPNVNYDGDLKADHSTCVINDKQYNAYGVFNFTHDDGSGFNHKETILGLSYLGQICNGVEIKNQRIEENGDPRYIWVNNKACYYKKDTLKTITCSDYVYKILDYAFEGCTELESVTFGKYLEGFNTKAFFKCFKLSNVILNNSENLLYFGENSFAECTSLKEIRLCDSKVLPLNKIGSRAFEKSALEYFYVGQTYKNWYHNGKEIQDSTTSTPAFFAQDLRIHYPTHTFTRKD